MQLDRVPRRSFVPFRGTFASEFGVPTVAGAAAAEPAAPASAAIEPGARAARRPLVRSWLWIALACITLVGQGERFDVDSRFRSPGATLETYWRAVRRNDLQTVAECFVEPQASLPFPGMLWFLPPVERLHLESVHLASGTADDVVVVYEVRFTPRGYPDDQIFATSSELKRVGHEWRLVPGSGQTAVPEWKPYPRPVDI